MPTPDGAGWFTARSPSQRQDGRSNGSSATIPLRTPDLKSLLRKCGLIRDMVWAERARTTRLKKFVASTFKWKANASRDLPPEGGRLHCRFFQALKVGHASPPWPVSCDLSANRAIVWMGGKRSTGTAEAGPEIVDLSNVAGGSGVMVQRICHEREKQDTRVSLGGSSEVARRS